MSSIKVGIVRVEATRIRLDCARCGKPVAFWYVEADGSAEPDVLVSTDGTLAGVRFRPYPRGADVRYYAPDGEPIGEVTLNFECPSGHRVSVRESKVRAIVLRAWRAGRKHTTLDVTRLSR